MKRDEAHTLLRAAIESQQELRLEILEHQARIKRLMQHPHEGGFGLADDAAQVISEQQKLDRKFADQRRVNAVYVGSTPYMKSAPRFGEAPAS
jgi:hypothetical protein